MHDLSMFTRLSAVVSRRSLRSALSPIVVLSFVSVASIGVVMSGCSDPAKVDPSVTTPSGTTSAASVTAATSASGSAVPMASGGASGAPATSGSGAAGVAGVVWKGTFKAKVGAVTPPKDANVEVWTKDPGTASVGDGTMTLTVTPTPAGKFSRVVGEGSGALGDLVISGTLDADGLTARVDSKDPNAPNAMNGVLTGKADSAKIEATLRVSGRDGNVVREATVTLTH